MATREVYKMSLEERKKRIFSEDFKKKKVEEIEQKKTTILEVSKEYEVHKTNVRRWMEKYGKSYKKGIRMVVETESDTRRIAAFQARIAALEQAVGQKQLIIDFQIKMIELAEEEYRIDIKKKFENEHSFSSGKSENSSNAV